MQRAEANDSLDDVQYGGRAGRSAIDLACQRIATFETYRIQRITAIEKSLDVAECFDRTIENCQNLSCLQNGADPNYIRLHAQTRNLLQYHVKHAYEVSKQFNQHSPMTPWHGSGQGMGNAAARWIVQANSMIRAYKSTTHPSTLQSPNTSITLNLSIDAFMDDTWMPATSNNNSALQELTGQAQQNLQKWHDILQSSGGQLNPKKCVWMLFNWHFKPSGAAQLRAPPVPPEITTTIKGSEPYPIWRLQPNEAHRYLGIQLTTDGNHKRELQIFKDRTQRYTNFIHQCPLTTQEARVVYLQCYLPTISYPLPATSFPPEKIIKIQGSATSAFLSKMGYPRTFPRAITYVSTRRGGLGFRHLGHEQGVQQCLQLLKHIRSNTTMGKTYQLLIQHYQLHAGFRHSILEKTDTIQWSVAPWMDNIRKFLRHINGQIIQKQPWTPQPHRQHDRAIMEDIQAYHFPRQKAIQLNSVRLYLRINYLSEITNHTGTQLLTHKLQPPQPHKPSFYYDNPNQSSLLWPNQPLPGRTAWKQWKDVITWMYATTDGQTLQQPLGPWLHKYDQDYQWNWTVNPTTQELYHKHGTQWHVY